jgi:hypothetical protein
MKFLLMAADASAVAGLWQVHTEQDVLNTSSCFSCCIVASPLGSQ